MATGQARDSRGRFLNKGAAAEERAPEERDEIGYAKRRLVQTGRPKPPKSWTEEKRDRFLAVLADTCNVAAAARAVGMTASTAYRLRQRDATFRRAWRQAISEGYARLEIKMLERALIAEERLRGALSRTPDDEEALGLLGRAPSRMAELLYRVHRQTAIEFDLEADPDPDGEQALAEINRRVDAIRARLLAGKAEQ